MNDATTKLHHFNGGLVLPSCKEACTSSPLEPVPLSRRLTLPLQQHAGASAQPVVAVGEHVYKGQLIARANGSISAAVHASTSGVVREIAEHDVPHPSSLRAPCIVLEADGEDAGLQPPPTGIQDYSALDPAAIRERVHDAGIVGLGGAVFPTAVKLAVAEGREVELLVINGTECEPCISCDAMLMRERAAEVIEGSKILRHALNAGRCILATQEDVPASVEALHQTIEQTTEEDPIELVHVPTVYPTGGERQLIKVLIGKEVPSGGLPHEIGVACFNVATVAAVFRAITKGEPLLSRIVTVTGAGVASPRNVEVRLGTAVEDLIAHCGGYTEAIDRLIMGGPMRGFSLHTDRVPVVKATNCILAMGHDEVAQPLQQMPCIRCGDCVRACPADLLPQQLYWYARAKDLDETQAYHLFDCIECGCCAYVCPSQIPLVQYFRDAKAQVWAREREHRKAEGARQRFEARNARLQREKLEREARMREKKDALARRQVRGDPKKVLIDAAVKRVQEKQRSRREATAGDDGPVTEKSDQTPNPR